MLRISAAQALAFRLHRQHLTAPAPSITAAARRLVGAQAQVQSAGLLQLALRTGVTTDAIAAAVDSRALVRLWAQRSTLHIVAAEDIGEVVALRHQRLPTLYESWAREGVPREQLDQIIQAVAVHLEDAGPQTRQEIAAGVARTLGDWVVPHLTQSWGGALKAAAAHGLLCHGPDRPRETAFAHLPSWAAYDRLDPRAGFARLAQRYLRAFGPSSVRDFKRFVELPVATVQAAWADLQTVPVMIADHGEAEVLAEDADALAETEPDDSIIALPLFDPWLLAHRVSDLYLAPQHRKHIYRQAGWISATILQGGRVIATWRHDDGAHGRTLTLTPFARTPRVLRRRIETALVRLHDLDNAPLQDIVWP